MNISAAERAELAARLRLSEQYLYQCLTGRRRMDAAEAVRVERESGGLLRRWHLRKSDWHAVWPELVGSDGAPAVAVESAHG